VLLGVDLGPSDKNHEIGNVILTQKEMTLVLPEKDDFYQLNSRKTGVFCVNYTFERLFKLGKAVKKGMLNTGDRIGIMADAGALVASGHGRTSGLLSFINEFENDGLSNQNQFIMDF